MINALIQCELCYCVVVPDPTIEVRGERMQVSGYSCPECLGAITVDGGAVEYHFATV